METIRIQIINYKTKKYLVSCLSSLQADLDNSRFGYSVAILDNASGDDLSDIGSLFPTLENLEICQGAKNIGYGAGLNFLSKKSEARFLFFLNPDVRIIENKTIDRLVNRIDDSKVQVVGPRLITEHGNTQPWDHGELHGQIARDALNSGHSHWLEREELTVAAWVSGAALLIDRNWFHGLGGFDENFFLYKEEEDLCWRLRGKHGKILYDPTITILHHGGVVAQKKQHMQKSVDYFITKHIQKNS